MMAFQKAERTGMYAKVALVGPSGSGKSYGALLIATGMVKTMGGGSRIAFINTERNRGELYSDRFDYDIENLSPDFTPELFVKAINEAIDAGYKVIIVDSASHEWMGQGGVMEQLDRMPGENSYVKWAKLTPRHNKFIDTLRDSPAHIIVCLRGKDEYALEEGKNGKKVPRKVGVGAQMRDGLEYEMHLAFNLSMDHVASVEGGKDNTTMFDGKFDVITEKTGVAIYQWATSGKAVPPPSASQPPAAGTTPPSEKPANIEALKAEMNQMKTAFITLVTSVDEAMVPYFTDDELAEARGELKKLAYTEESKKHLSDLKAKYERVLAQKKELDGTAGQEFDGAKTA